ncbi:ATP-binding cassette domain-containing protein [Pseudoduganella eburnea]|uniref:ATP-binding cassette domain-containing protein n=1 Tax=Massilia eburnea TaxID=1776165 RepID=A0A6L6QBX8_9BURK|nr:ATP-binding cassette domain-containing protein [Massilia eburnea]MTW10018.1 ATP-binding cassette domain-containing protein [Massilia eburnea]
MSSVLRAEHLTRRLPGAVPVTLVDDVSLEVQRGEFICIMGPSGSGKSSLLYLLGLLDRPDSGKVWLADKDTSACDDNQLAAMRLAKLGFVFQFHFLLAEFTVAQNVLLPMQRLGLRDGSAAAEHALGLLDRLGIADQAHKFPSQLSGGQRQRAALARALANDPLLILADEPTGNLDSAATQNVRQLLRSLADGGQTVIAVTHDHEFAKAADRVLGLVDGRQVVGWRP